MSLLVRFTLTLALAPAFAFAAVDAPEYVPSCSYPQIAAPAQSAGGVNVPSITAMAWNGQEYGLFWHDKADFKYYFRRVYADGTPASAKVFIANSGSFYRLRVGLVWTGSEYGATWAMVDGSGWIQVYFARLSRTGAILSGPTRVSWVGGSPTNYSDTPSLAWNGSGYAVVWEDSRSAGDYNIYATLLDATGAVAGGGSLHDLLLVSAVDPDLTPTVVWSSAAARYLFFWEHWNAGYSVAHVNRGTLTPAGGIGILPQIDSSPTFAQNITAAGDGSGFVAVWNDTRDGNSELYGIRLNGWGTAISPETRLTTTPENEGVPLVAWTGSEYATFHAVSPASQVNDIWTLRLSPSLAVLSAPFQLTFSGNAYYPRAAFGRYGFLVSYADFVSNSLTGPNHVLPMSCNYSYSPGCPANPIAYNLSGTGATLAWQAADDPYTDIAYYGVYRNNAPVGATSDTYFSDSGLSLGTPYNYSFRAVNAAQLSSPSNCPSIYVKTNATLTLTVNKATASDAGLYWTDAGFNNYNIFRGTSPQVMSQTGATPELSSTDPNALNDTVSYFYSVDNPGP